jgi:hypothetical protein
MDTETWVQNCWFRKEEYKNVGIEKRGRKRIHKYGYGKVVRNERTDTYLQIRGYINVGTERRTQKRGVRNEGAKNKGAHKGYRNAGVFEERV